METGSFTKAAEELCYTASGVSQLVNALENDLGVQLLHRSKRGVTLTENGERFLPAIRTILSREDSVYQMAAEINGLQIGSTSIAAYLSIATQWLPKVIRDFQKKYPQIVIHLMEGIRPEIAEKLNNGQADLAFLSYREPMEYEWIPLAEVSMLAVLPQSHPLADAEAYPLSYCEKDLFITSERNEDDDVMKMLKKHGVQPNICFSTKESFAAIPLIEQGIGISIMSELLTKRWEWNVKRIPLDPPQRITLGIAALDFEKLTPAAKRFLKFAAERLTDRESR